MVTHTFKEMHRAKSPVDFHSPETCYSFPVTFHICHAWSLIIPTIFHQDARSIIMHASNSLHIFDVQFPSVNSRGTTFLSHVN